MMGGAPTEASVIQRAQMADPAAAALGHPSNLELMPVWMKIVAAGLNRPPAGEEGSSNSTEAGTSDTGAGGMAGGIAGAIGGLVNGGFPLVAGNGPIEEYGDQESNAAIQ